MAAVLRTRLEAAAGVLATLADDDTRKRASSVHKATILAMLKPILPGLGDNDRADLSSDIMAMGWSGTDGEDICRVVLGNSGEAKLRQTRRKMQDYRSFVAFLTEHQWEALLAENVGLNQKQEIIIIATLISCGCRCPSEKTKLLAYELWLHVSGKTRQTNKRLKDAFGKELKMASHRAGTPMQYLLHLPTPADFNELHPEFYCMIFPDAQPGLLQD